MSDANFRRIVWTGTIIFGAIIWGFAFIGAKNVASDVLRLSVWTAAERPTQCAR